VKRITLPQLREEGEARRRGSACGYADQVTPPKVPNGDVWHAVVREDGLGISMPMYAPFDQGGNA
jgi:hypothetical protein